MAESQMPGLGATPTVLREMNEADREPVERLWFERFDHDPDGVDWVFDHIDGDERPLRGVVAKNGADIAGFGVAFPAYKEAVEQDYYDGQLSGVPGDTGVMHMGIVDEAYESQGIGRRLFQDRVNYLEQFPIQAYIGTAWLRPDGHSSAALFEDFGFTSVAEVESFYTDARECAVCGRDQTCDCDARIYVYPDEAAANVEVTG